MKIDVQSFRGEVPRLTPRALPDNAAQEAINCRMQSGDLECWRQFLAEKLLEVSPDPDGLWRTIYKLNGKWLSWPTQVDTARGLIPGDTNFFLFLTGPDQYTTPRYTTFSMATTGGEPYPVATRPLGVPAPDTPPDWKLGVAASDPTKFSVNTVDLGDGLTASWTTSPNRDGGGTFGRVLQDAVLGNSAPSYKLQYDENRDPGSEVFAYRNFGIAGASAVSVSVDFYMTDDLGVTQASVTVAASSTGGGIRAVYVNGNLSIQKATEWGVQFGTAVLSSVVVTPALSGNTWYKMTIVATSNADGTRSVTVKLLDGALVELATLTATGNFEDGDYCGIANGIGSDAGTRYQTNYDNISVSASGATGVQIVNIATSYVYTFRNTIPGTDVKWESAPSPASTTLLRPDGVEVTITTPTTVPGGTDPLYGIATKRIYRAVTGATGTIFLFVAEIPLGQADFVDNLDDSQVGPAVLESEDWDLPPATMQGIIALPNNIMAGFFRNQLCLSAVGRPHAWPVKYRLTTDTDIVAIANIDNTIVIGTKSFVYTATGNDPSGYAMSKPGEPQACVAKLGMVYVDGTGVAFPSPDGYQVCAGSAGNVRNATETIFTKKQWQALHPETIVAAVHDGVLHWFLDDVGVLPSAASAQPEQMTWDYESADPVFTDDGV